MAKAVDLHVHVLMIIAFFTHAFSVFALSHFIRRLDLIAKFALCPSLVKLVEYIAMLIKIHFLDKFVSYSVFFIGLLFFLFFLLHCFYIIFSHFIIYESIDIWREKVDVF